MKALRNRALIKMNLKQNAKYAFDSGVVIDLEHGFNFNLREDRGTKGYIIDGCGLPEGTEVLVHYLSSEPQYLVSNEEILTEEEKTEGYKVFAIPEDNVFIYMDKNGEWKPCKEFLITTRIYKPYTGIMVGVEPQLVTNRMYVISGSDDWDDEQNDLSGKVLVTLDHADYEIIFYSKDNKEGRIIRTRTREIQAVDEFLTKKVKKGEYIIGRSPSEAKTLNQFQVV